MTYRDQLELFQDKDYRETYLAAQVCTGIAYQVQALRRKDGTSQKEFADKVGKPQSVISRLEDTEYGKVTVQTLLDIACGTDVALIIKFVSYSKFLLEYEDLTPENLKVDTIYESLDHLSLFYSGNRIPYKIFAQVWDPVRLDSSLFWNLPSSTQITIDSQGNHVR